MGIRSIFYPIDLTINVITSTMGIFVPAVLAQVMLPQQYEAAQSSPDAMPLVLTFVKHFSFMLFMFTTLQYIFYYGGLTARVCQRAQLLMFVGDFAHVAMFLSCVGWSVDEHSIPTMATVFVVAFLRLLVIVELGKEAKKTKQS